jgi:hypothetical protein
MKARACHKTQVFRVKALRWVEAETSRKDRPKFVAEVLEGRYLVWRTRFEDGRWSSWRWTYGTLTSEDEMRSGWPTAAAAKEAAERDWVLRLGTVLAPAGMRVGKGGAA